MIADRRLLFEGEGISGDNLRVWRVIRLTNVYLRFESKPADVDWRKATSIEVPEADFIKACGYTFGGINE